MKNSLYKDYLLLEFERIHLLLWGAVLRLRSQLPSSSELPGFGISDEEIDRFMCSSNTPAINEHDRVQKHLREETIHLESKIAERRQKAESKHQIIRTERFRTLFQLNPFEQEAFLLCCLPEIDTQYEKVFAYLQDDLTKKYVNIDLLLNVLCCEKSQKLQARASFMPDAPLLAHMLVELSDDNSRPPHSFLGKVVKPDTKIVNYLLCQDKPDPNLHPYREPDFSGKPKKHPVYLDSVKRQIERLISDTSELTDPGNFLFHGPAGTGKRSAAKMLSRALGKSMIIIDTRPLSALDNKAFRSIINRILREALVENASVYFSLFEMLLQEDKKYLCRQLYLEQTRYSVPVILSIRSPAQISQLQRFGPITHIEFAYPRPDLRVRYWQHTLGDQAAISDIQIVELAQNYQLTAEQIENAVHIATHTARLQGREKPSITVADLQAACRLQSIHKLGEFAQKIDSGLNWSQLILPAEQKSLLLELCTNLRFRTKVFKEWGFERNHANTMAISVLFTGPSGTGKTTAAAILAKQLGLDIYRIDLSGIVSKYIGETEKNLAKIFKEAESSNVILFFDECDALFGKRTEVRDAHDRYANIETSYLLQKMDEYDGIVIMASNFKQNIDKAFMRRIRYIIDFPFPDKAHRRLIWQALLPQSAPLSRQMDWDFLADKVKLAGGDIRNIILNAAMIAVSTDREITMACLLKAVKREYKKLGMAFLEPDFNPYYALADGHIHINSKPVGLATLATTPT